MAEGYDTSVTREISAAEGLITAVISETSGDEFHTLVVDERWPRAFSQPEVSNRLRDALSQQDLSAQEIDEWLTNISPGFEMSSLGAALRYKTILDAFGFSLEYGVQTVDRDRVAKKVATYPSIARSNRLMEELMGESGAEYATYDGSLFPALNFAQAFVNIGQPKAKILEASRQPHAIHDAYLHRLGWLAGADPELIDILRDRMEPYLERETEERKLPPLPYSFDTKNYIGQLVTKSSEVLLGHVVAELDGFSDTLAQILIFMNYSGSVTDKQLMATREAVSRLFSNYSIGPREPGLGKQSAPLLGNRLSTHDNNRIANNILARYARAEEMCLERTAGS